MSNRIPQEFIAELLDRTDLVELVGRRVTLTRAGSEYKARCPFHEEKTPSFYVSPAKQFYHCFGCQEHGTAIDFLMNHDHLGFLEAVEELATLAGLEVPRGAGRGGEGPGEALYETLAASMSFYRQCLERADTARDYLAGRGVDAQTAETFLLGYAPDAWDSVLRRLGTSAEGVRRLVEAGLVITREGEGDGGERRYDRFRDRIMFPIRDVRGRVIAFGGRILGKGRGDGRDAKYLNSPETPLFHKGRELYGLYEMRRAVRNIQRVLVVEGYMDVIALHQLGVPNVVATLGTSTTADHLTRLFRVTDEVVFCFDGDRAGRAAAWRALQNALPEVREGRQLRFLFLPDGEDPDSLIRNEGRERFAARVDAAVPLSEFLIGHLAEGLALDSVDGRARLAELARPLIGRVPAGVYRQLLVRELGEAVGLPPAALDPLIPATEAGRGGIGRHGAGGYGEGGAPPAPVPRRRAPRRPRQERDTPVRRAMRLVLNYPAIAADMEDVTYLATLPLPGASLLAEVIEVARRHPNITSAGLVERWRDDPFGRHLAALAAERPAREALLEADGEPAESLRYWLREIQRAAKAQRKRALGEKAAAEGLTEAEKREYQQLERESRRDLAQQAPRGD